MALMLGSFAGGLWNGASSAMSLATAYQNYQQQSALNDARNQAASSWAAAQGAGANTPPVTDPNAGQTAAIAGGTGASPPPPNANTNPDAPANAPTTPPGTTPPGTDGSGDGKGAGGKGAGAGGKGAIKITSSGDVTVPAWAHTDVGIRAISDAAARVTGQVNTLATPPPPPPNQYSPPAPATSVGSVDDYGRPITPPAPAAPAASGSSLTQWPAPGTVPLTSGGTAGPPAPPSAIGPNMSVPMTNRPVGATVGAGGGPSAITNKPVGSTLAGATSWPSPGTVPLSGNAPVAGGPGAPQGTAGIQGAPGSPSGPAPNAPAPSAISNKPVGQGVGATVLGALKSAGQAVGSAIMPSAEAAETPASNANTPEQARAIAAAQAKDSGKPVPLAGSNGGMMNPDGTFSSGPNAGGLGTKDRGLMQPSARLVDGKGADEAPAKPEAPSPSTPARPQSGAIPPTVTAKVAPGETAPAQQSEQTPVARPMVNPSAWNKLPPEDQGMLNNVVQKYGQGYVTPQELAMIWQREGGLQHSGVPDNPSDPGNNPHGPFQIKPRTQAAVDHTGQFDTSTAENGAIVATKLLVKFHTEDQYPPGSVLSHYAYWQGEGAAHAVANGAPPDPTTVKSLAAAFPGVNIEDALHNGGSGRRVSDQTVTNTAMAAARKGPDAFLNAITDTGATGLGMSSLWRTAQSSMERYAIMSGHIDALPAISDLFAQQSHQGAVSNLMAAHNMLLSGNGAGAAQAMAKAHAFFPDGTYGQFGTDSQGNLWAKQFSEQTGKPIGQPFQVGPQDVARQMIALQNPRTYLQTLQDYRQKNAQIDLAQAHGEYYQQRPQVQLAIEAGREGAAAQRQQVHESAEDARNTARIGAKGDTAGVAEDKAIASEAKGYYGPSSQPYADAQGDAGKQEKLGQMGSIYTELRKGGQMAGPAADNAAQQITGGKWKVTPKQDANGRPYNEITDDKGNRRGYLSNEAMGRIRGLAGSGAPPPKNAQMTMAGPGAGMGSPGAAMGGYNQNMAGGPQQAIPVSTGVPQPAMAP